MILTVMDDYEAYGQLRDRGRPPVVPASEPQLGGKPGRPPAPPQAIAPPRRRKRSHWVRNVALLIVAYFVLAVVTTVQPVPVPGTALRVAAPFPGGAPVLFGRRHTNSRDAALLLAARGAVAVSDVASLLRALRIVLTEADTRAHAGRAAREVVRGGIGAAERSTELVEELLGLRVGGGRGQV